jgi:hypothetical protein
MLKSMSISTIAVVESGAGRATSVNRSALDRDHKSGQTGNGATTQRMDVPARWAGPRVHEVAEPSQKILLDDGQTHHLSSMPR